MKPRNNFALNFSARPSNWLGLCTLTFSLLAAGSAMAQTSTWDGGGGSGLWNLNTNWSTDTLPVAATATTYIFGGNVQNSLNNDISSIQALSIRFTNNGLGSNTNAFTLAGNSITLTTQNNAVVTTAIGSGGTNIVDTLSANLIATGIRSFSIGLGHDLIFSGAMSGTSGSISKGGQGTLTMSGANSYTGITYVDSGTLKLGASNVIPDGSTLEVKRGSTTDTNPIFDLAGFSDTIFGITLGQTSTTSSNGGGQPTIIDSGSTKGILTLGSNISYRAGTTGNLIGQATISANLATGNAARSFTVGDGSATEDLVISGAISGSGTITKAGAGTLLLSGANTHTGQLTIDAGTVKLGANDVLPEAATNIVQLGVNGSTSGVFLDINGKTDTVGPLTINGAGGSNNPGIAGLTHSIIDSTGGGVLTLGNTFNVYAGAANQYGQATISANINTGNSARNLTVEDSTQATVDLLISGQIVGASSGFNKAGAGVLALSGANTYGGVTFVSAGVLLLNGPTALPGGIGVSGGTNVLNLSGGILGLGDGSFTRALGTGVTQVNISADNSGFAAFGANRIVNLGGLSAGVTWGSGNFMTAGNNFVLSHTTATHTLDFQNPIALSGTRYFVVNNGTAVVDARLSGAITGSTTFSKAGSGTLEISNSGNAWTGLTYIDSGTLRLGANDVIPGGGIEIKRAAGTDTNPILDLNGFSDTVGGVTLGAPTTSATNVGQTVSIVNSPGGSATLTLGGTLTYNAGTATFENGQALISANLIVNGTTDSFDRTFQVGNGSAAVDLLVTGNVTSGGTSRGILKNGTGTMTLSGTNDWSGQTRIVEGAVRLGSISALPSAGRSVVFQGGTATANTTNPVLDLNGFNASIFGLTLNLTTPVVGGIQSSVVDSATGGLITLGSSLAYNAGAGGALDNGQSTVSANLSLGAATRTFTVNDSSLAATDVLISGVLSGATGSGMTKAGAGVLALSGANTYNGLTTVNASTLTLQNNLALQNSALVTTGSGAVTLAGGITTPTFGGLSGATGNLATVISSGYGSVTALTLNPNSGSVTYGGVIANGFSGMTLTKTGAGIQILSGANSYSGNTNVNGGNLVIAGTQTGSGQLIVSNAAILTFGDGSSTNGSSTNSGTIFVNNTGTVQINKADGGTVTNAVASNPSATTTLAGGNANGTTNTFTATSYNNGGGFSVNSANAGATLAFSGTAGAIDLKGTNLTVSGAGDTLLTSAGQGFYSSTTSSKVIKQGTGTLIFQGNQGFTGNMEIDAGTVRVDLAQTNTGTYFVGNGTTTGTAASLLVGGGSAGLTGGVTFNRTITMNPGNGTNRTVGGTNTAGTNVISSALNMSGTFGEDRSVTLTAAAEGTVDISGAVTGAGQNIIKTGSGTVILSNASGNTYTGNTSVNAGKLVVTGAVTGSAFSVSNAGSVLASDAAASIGSGLTINNGAILAPGDAAAAGTITVGASGTTFNNDSIFSWDINAAGTSYDKLITPTVAGEAVAGDAMFRIVVADSTFANSFWTSNQTWADIFTTNGSTAIASWAAVFGNSVSVVNSGFTTLDTSTYGSFTITGSSLTWSAVPEPSSALAGLLIAAGLLRRRRA